MALLVGRDAELARLDECLKRRDFVALEVVGEPGIGKTRLLAELEHAADRHGRLVLTGSASELEADLPFGVFVDALDEYLHGLEPRRLEALPPELGAIFPSLPAATADRYRLHRAVSTLLDALAPLVVILDDVHWADTGSLELLAALLRRPPTANVVLAIAVRPRQIPERLAVALERATALTQIELSGLSRDEARALVGDDAHYDASGGNPFYLRQLARVTPPEGHKSGVVEFAGVEVPRAVAAALASELAMLSGPAREALAGAAVAGDPFEPELAAAAAGIDEPTMLDALDELVTADLARATDVPRRFRFRHPLVRRAVYESAPAGWRISAHDRAAAALAARGATAVERAHHVERSARRGDLEAVAVLSAAAEEVRGRAPATTARLYGAALRLCSAPDPGLLFAQAQAHHVAGEWRAAHAALLEALVHAPGDVPMTALCAAVEHLLGLHDEAKARLEAALRALPSETGHEAAMLLRSLALDAFFAMDFDAMREWAQRTVDAARPLGDRALTASALGLLTLGATFAGRTDAALPARAEGAALIDSLSDDELVRSVDAICVLAAAEVMLDLPLQATVHSDRGLAVAEASGHAALQIHYWTATVRTLRGQLRSAAEVFDNAIEISRVTNNGPGLVWNLCGRSYTAVLAGDHALALSCAQETRELLRGDTRSFVSTAAGQALAGALFADGDAAGAHEVLLDAGGSESLQRIPGPWRAGALEVLTRIRLALGDRAGAERAAEHAQVCAAELGVQSAAGMADRANALVTGDAVLALRSAAAFEAAGAPVQAAFSRMAAGQVLAAAGEIDRAAAELDAAAAAFEACGAPGQRDAAERELRRIGRRSTYRRTRQSDLAELTERELQVARLVVDRRTNAEIAAELYLSTKTVESHLRNLFHKLGVSSRVEVARAVERAERAAV